MSSKTHIGIGICLAIAGWTIVGGVALYNGYFDFYAFITGAFLTLVGLSYVAAILGGQP